ncbi:hypothetical protein [Lysinibacillus sp. RC79]|uniref:hypothetical protein n=1 Tax=Lysinibacillus sp. RC79 TaxID=3156296 RepID=UPI003515A494
MNPKEKLEVIQYSLYIENGEILFNQEHAKENGLSLEIINAIKNKVAEENTNEIKALNVETLIFPIIIWAADILGSYLSRKFLNLGTQSFCSVFKDTNYITKLVCDELNL